MNKLRNLIGASSSHGVATVLAIVFCFTQLSGCGVVGKGSNSRLFPSSYDGPPDIDIETSRLHDAVPKVEPLHPYGTRDYVVNGRRYHVLKTAKGYVKRGYASWYGSKFHGQETSTQEIFNLYGMTAASPELPLPSYAQVTNLHNGKKVIVRINDRGPFCSNRVLDLSYAAAKKLGFGDRGVVPVKIVGIDPKTWSKTEIHLPSKEVRVASSSQQAKDSHVFLQVGAFTQINNAKELSARLNKITDKPVQISHKTDLYRVQIGPLVSSSQSDKLKLVLEKHGFENVTVVDGSRGL